MSHHLRLFFRLGETLQAVRLLFLIFTLLNLE